MEGKNDMLVDIFSSIFKIIWRGILLSKRYKLLLLTYIILGLYGFINYVTNRGGLHTIIAGILFIAFIMGMIEWIKEYPVRKKRKQMMRMFYRIGLSSHDVAPDFLFEEDISRYAKVLSFHTIIPLHEWQNKIGLLEMGFHKKIIEIVQNSKDNRIIEVVIEKYPLPTKINWNNDYFDYDNNILNIGISHFGIIGINLDKHPHTFIAGETGSGKSNILKCLIYQSITKGYDCTLIDFKRGVSFNTFSDVLEIEYKHKGALKVLNEAVEETNRRLDIFRESGVEKLSHYNKIRINRLPRKIIFIDELAELLKKNDKEMSKHLYDSIETLTRLSRAVGIHLIMGIQRPDSTIINGQIKNNVSCRICGHFVDREPSRIMLNSDIASRLENIKGRFIVKDDFLEEVQCFYYQGERLVIPKSESKIDELLPHGVPVEKKKQKKEPAPKEEIDFDFSDV
jgi:energy-coupling factor transporter ATP-binding protein EcfA2